MSQRTPTTKFLTPSKAS